MREQSFFEAAKKNQGELEAFGGMQAHQRDLRAFVVVVGVGDEGGVVEELVESFAAVARVHGGVDQFAKILDAGEGFGRVFVFQKLDVAGAVDQEFQDIGGRDRGGWESGVDTFASLGLGRDDCSLDSRHGRWR